MRKRKGFTLVELMVVIAVIATLATVSVIGYRTFVRRETINASVTEADQAAQVIISQVASSNEGQITLYNKDTGNKLASLGEVYFTYENGNLQVNSEYPAGTTTTKDSIVEFDSALRYYFPSIVSLPGTFTMQAGAIYYHHLSVDEIIELFDNHYADIYEPDNPSTPYNINDVAIDIISLDFITLEESGNASGSDSDGIKFSLGQSTLFLTKGETLPVNYYISDGTTISKSDIQYDSSYLSIDIYEDHFDLTGKKVTTQPIYVLFNVGRIRKTLKVKICESGRVIVSIPELINTIYWNNEYQSPNDLSKWSVDGDKVILKSCDSGKEPGIYSATFELSDTEEYCWEDDFSYGVKVVNWRINKIVVETPYQVVYHSVRSSALHTAKDMQYDGSIQLPDWDAATVALQDKKILSWQTQTRDLGIFQKAYNKNGDYDYGYANPGQYDAIFTITDTAHYKWADSINTNKTVHWHVYKTQVEKPTIKEGFTEFEYDGNEKIVYKTNTASSNKSSNGVDGLNNFDSDLINLNGGVDKISATNRGEYKITVSLDDPSKYEWSDGVDYSQKAEPYVREYRDAATNDFYLYWKITPKPMNIPVNDTFHVDYNGLDHVDEVTAHYVPSNLSSQLELTGVLKAVNVGAYDAYIKITDTNYCWSYNKATGVIDEADKNLTWCIDPVYITIPTLKYPTKKYYFTPANFGTDYSGKQVTVELNDVKVTGDNGTNKTISIGDATTKYLTVNGITQKNASSEDYTVTLHLQNPAGIVNVKWNTTDGNLTDDREVKWHLYPYEISVNTLGIIQKNSLTYTGESLRPDFGNTLPTILETDASSVNAEEKIPTIFTVATNHQRNYVIKEGTNTVTWKIGKRALTPKADIVTGGYVYTGSAITPEVVFEGLQNNETLTKGTDYSLSYENNTNAGNTASITITLLNTTKTNNYTLNGNQSKKITFAIEKADSSYTKPTAKTGLTYNGSAQTLINAATNVVGGTVNYGLGTETSQPSSWSTTLPTGKDAKTYYVWSKVVGDGNHNDTAASTSNVVQVTIAQKSLSSATFSDISAYTYGGDEKKPEPTVTVDGKTLTKTTDFTYSYSDNKNAGTATVTITGKGNYSGTVSKTFTINTLGLSNNNVTFSNISAYTYGGDEKKPEPTVTVDGKTLTKATDFTYSYSNNTNAGTATVTITGKGNCSGTVSKTFTINTLGLSNNNVTFSNISAYTYDGNEKKPEPTVKVNGTSLSSTTDFTYSYSNNTNAGTATVTITGKGNYSGTASKTFTINARTISNSNTTFGNISAYTYDGNEKKPEPTVTVDGKTLTKTTDFTYDYSNNKNAGTATVTITGKGNYSGTASKTFTIGKASTSKPSNTVSKTYTGTNQGNDIGTTNPGLVYVSGNTSGTNVGNYEAYYKPDDNHYWEGGGDGNVKVTLAISPKEITPLLDSTEYKYTGSAIVPTVKFNGLVGGQTLSKGTDYTVTLTDNTTVGKNKTVIIALTAEVKNYTLSKTELTFEIIKVDSSYTKPTAKTGLTYNGSTQTLINAATNAVGGTVYYGLSTETVAPSLWSTDLPTGTDAGTYYVWSKLVGDSNHNDTAASYAVSVTIGKADPKLSVTLDPHYLDDTKTIKTYEIDYNGDGKLSASNKNTSTFGAAEISTTVEGKTLSVQATALPSTGGNSNEFKITILATEGKNYNSASFDCENKFEVKNPNSSCVTSDTMILMGDGTEKMIKDVERGEEIMTYNMNSGKFEPQPAIILWDEHHIESTESLHLTFDDGTLIKVVGEHGFFDKTLNTYSYINYDNYEEFIGHDFVAYKEDGYRLVKLIKAEIIKENVEKYSIESAYNDNFITNGLISMTQEPVKGRFEYFKFSDNVTWDQKDKQAMIDQYGLYTYDEWKEYIPDEEMFYAVNGPYFKILVEKGIVTMDDIWYMMKKVKEGTTDTSKENY